MTTSPKTKILKWVKILVDFFDDEKIKLIDGLGESRDAILVIWFKLLAVAGKSNSGGLLILDQRIPYTDEMLATIFNRPLNTVRVALKTLESLGMIAFTEERIIQIEDWDKFQSLDSGDRQRELTRERVERHRKNKKLREQGVTLPEALPVTHVTPLEQETEIEKEKTNNNVVVAFESAEKGKREIELLIEAGFSLKDAHKLIEEEGQERVKDVVEYSKSKKPTNLPGYILTVLQSGNTPAKTNKKTSTQGGTKGKEQEKYEELLVWWRRLPPHKKNKLLDTRNLGHPGSDLNFPEAAFLRNARATLDRMVI